MDIELLSRITDKLEENLRLIGKALEFVDSLTPEDMTSQDDQRNVTISKIKHVLTCYVVFDANPNMLKQFLRECLEKQKNWLGHSDLGSLLWFRDHNNVDPIVRSFNFNADVDRIFKEIDAHLCVVCEILKLNPPSHPKEGKIYSSSEDWGRNGYIEALNILGAAKSILGG